MAPSECFNIEATSPLEPLDGDGGGHLIEPAEPSSGRGGAFSSAPCECPMELPSAAVAQRVALMRAAGSLSLERGGGGGGGGGGISNVQLSLSSHDFVDCSPQVQTPAMTTTRVAFATADIRRALARLTTPRPALNREPQPRPSPMRVQSVVTGRRRRPVYPDGVAQAAGGGGQPGSQPSQGAGRRFKITRDGWPRRNHQRDDDLCPSTGRHSAAHLDSDGDGDESFTWPPLSLSGNQQQRRQQQQHSRRQQKVFGLSTDCDREQQKQHQDQQRHNQVRAWRENSCNCNCNCRRCCCSGSISMNHLNEIKTSAAAICCPSLRRRSYGVNDIIQGQPVGAQAVGQSPSKQQQQQQRQASWLARIASSATAATFGNRQIQTNHSFDATTSGSGGSERFMLRPDSIDFEQVEQRKVNYNKQQQVAGSSGSSHSKSTQAQQVMMAGSAAAAQSLQHQVGSELMHSQELMGGPKSAGSSSLSLSVGANLGSSGASGNANKNFSKLVGKKAARFKELVLQNLGKADRTQDELFDLYELNFYKQQQQVGRLTKEFKSYLAALRHFHEASRSLNKCIQHSTSDYQSARHDLVCENLAQLETLNEDLLEKLHEQVLKQVGEYLTKFGEMKEKISKRHRKLIDYDKSRRLYELTLAQVNKRRVKQNQALCSNGGGNGGANEHHQHQQEDSENYHSILRGLKFLSQQQQQTSTITSQQEFIASQLVDEARLLKFREEFNYSKLMYESINGELHDELPIVYEKKMKSLLTALQSYFALEAHYHSNAGKLVGTVSEVIDEMPNCSTLLHQAMTARKLSGERDDASNHQTIIGAGNDNHEVDVDDDDDDEDDDSYQLSSSTSSDAGDRAHGSSGVGGGGGPNAGDKSRQLAAGHVGGSSSGLGSSRGESSCSVGSSSPDCPAPANQELDELVAGPSDCSGQDQRDAVVAVADGASGKAEGPADCSAGVVEPQLDQPDTKPAAAAAASEIAQADVAANEPTTDDGAPNEASTSSATCGIDMVVGTETDNSTSVDPTSDSLSEYGATGSQLAVAASSQANFLYKVRTNYKYLAEDVDELCFEPDEIIQVIEFDENQEPEEGWLMGVREINGQRGLFPANFTQPICNIKGT